MTGDIKSILVHLLIIVIASYLLYRYHGRVNRFVSRRFKQIQKSFAKKSHQRYAARVNREEAKLFGKDKYASRGGHSASSRQIKSRRSSRSNTHG